jgi:hypothetical protein
MFPGAGLALGEGILGAGAAGAGALGGALIGAGTSAISGGNPLTGALSGGLGGSGVLGNLTSSLPDLGSPILNSTVSGALQSAAKAALTGGDIGSAALTGGVIGGGGKFLDQTALAPSVPTMGTGTNAQPYSSATDPNAPSYGPTTDPLSMTGAGPLTQNYSLSSINPNTGLAPNSSVLDAINGTLDPNAAALGQGNGLNFSLGTPGINTLKSLAPGINSSVANYIGNSPSDIGTAQALIDPNTASVMNPLTAANSFGPTATNPLNPAQGTFANPTGMSGSQVLGGALSIANMLNQPNGGGQSTGQQGSGASGPWGDILRQHQLWVDPNAGAHMEKTKFATGGLAQWRAR